VRTAGKTLAGRGGGLLVSAGVDRRWCHIHLVRRVALHTAFWLVAWATVVPVTAWAADEAYTVRRGDTIYSIARSYGIPPAVLAERNGLDRSIHVYAGQRLVVPVKSTAQRPPPPIETPAQSIARNTLPRSIQHAIDKAPVRPGRWQYIVIHHSGVDTGTVKAMDQYHREVRHMENGLAYDFVIGNGSGMGDGEIAVGHRWTQQLDGGHLASEAQNKIALGICLVGNFDERRPTPREMDSLRALVEALMVRCKLTPSAVKTHQQINIVHTRCPGTRFPTKSFLDSL
jgi:murein DD-endopeptidase MepM/ murein hydrolase activator NlpD